LPLLAQAAESESCSNVRFADVGWTDITVTTAVTSAVLQSIGYTTKTTLISVPVTYKSMENKDIDVFLGNWMQPWKTISSLTAITAAYKPYVPT